MNRFRCIRNNLAEIELSSVTSCRNIQGAGAAVCIELWLSVDGNQVLHSSPNTQASGSQCPSQIDHVPYIQVPFARHKAPHGTLDAAVVPNDVAGRRIESFVLADSILPDVVG